MSTGSVFPLFFNSVGFETSKHVAYQVMVCCYMWEFIKVLPLYVILRLNSQITVSNDSPDMRTQYSEVCTSYIVSSERGKSALAVVKSHIYGHKNIHISEYIIHRYESEGSQLMTLISFNSQRQLVTVKFEPFDLPHNIKFTRSSH